MGIDKSFNNEFEKQLEKAGYKWFEDRWKSSLRGIQRRITDDKGIKYFITGYHYNFSKSFPESKLDVRDSYTFHGQFTFKKDGKEFTVNVEFWSDFVDNPWRNVATLQDVEDFFEKMWNDMGAEYYEEYSR